MVAQNRIISDKGGYYNIPSVPCALLGGKNVFLFSVSFDRATFLLSCVAAYLLYACSGVFELFILVIKG